MPVRFSGAGVLAACLLAVSARAAAQDERPSDETLRALQERGRLIGLYFAAVDRGAELLSAQRSGAPPSDRTIVIPGSTGWRVVYLQDLGGAASASGGARKGLAIVGETSFSPDARQVGTLELIVPPRTAPAALQSYARALDEAEAVVAARADGGKPFARAVLREKDGGFTVYVIARMPEGTGPAGASGASASVPFGRDFIIRVAATGRQTLGAEKLHESSAPLSLQPRPPGIPLLHEHDTMDLPAPTDVALVVRYPVLAPLLVVTPRALFRVDAEGAVTWLGPNPHPKPAVTATPGAGAPPAGGPG